MSAERPIRCGPFNVGVTADAQEPTWQGLVKAYCAGKPFETRLQPSASLRIAKRALVTDSSLVNVTYSRLKLESGNHLFGKLIQKRFCLSATRPVWDPLDC